MPKLVIWSEEMDTALKRLRDAGAGWEETARKVGVATGTAMRRARILNVPRVRMNVGPVPGRTMKQRTKEDAHAPA